MKEEILIAGFGGQGVLSLGWLLAEAAILEKKRATWLPSYGPAMRGGTANCTVIISSEDIGSPLTEHPTVLIVMNKPSLQFVVRAAAKGLIILNRSLVQWDNSRKNVKVVEVDAGNIAQQLGNLKVANAVILGALLKKKALVKMASAQVVLQTTFQKRPELLEINQKAITAGYEAV